jgi:5-(aminomethyl)-3-furanmethanol phosphate kinase
MWVVKLGGSLSDADCLPAWLSLLANRSELVLVPGGGPFADQVRIAQTRWGFADAAAHHLALLAMEQYGRMLCAIQQGLVPADSVEAIHEAIESGLTPVWMPVAMVLRDPVIPQSWDMTSDSLASWLSGRLGAEALLLIKSADLGDRTRSLDALARDGVVDPLLPYFAEVAGMPVHVLSIASSHALECVPCLTSGRVARNPCVSPPVLKRCQPTTAPT